RSRTRRIASATRDAVIMLRRLGQRRLGDALIDAGTTNVAMKAISRRTAPGAAFQPLAIEATSRMIKHRPWRPMRLPCSRRRRSVLAGTATYGNCDRRETTPDQPVAELFVTGGSSALADVH
ncbi:MAG: hypothetical protein Q7R41_11265, partial [Phycisphaerales bacterium]|nr:hypothetical protein [Phycisphaerales bacterium]